MKKTQQGNLLGLLCLDVFCRHPPSISATVALLPLLDQVFHQEAAHLPPNRPYPDPVAKTRDCQSSLSTSSLLVSDYSLCDSTHRQNCVWSPLHPARRTWTLSLQPELQHRVPSLHPAWLQSCLPASIVLCRLGQVVGTLPQACQDAYQLPTICPVGVALLQM